MKFKIGDRVRIKKGHVGEGLTGTIIEYGIGIEDEHLCIHFDKEHDLYTIANGGIQKIKDWYEWNKSDLEKVN